MNREIEAAFRPSRLRGLLDHFGRIADPREPAKVMYPLREILFQVVAATTAVCEDYDEIALWGEQHLSFRRFFSKFHFGTPCADCLRVVMNRIDPDPLHRLGAVVASRRLEAHRARRQDLAPQP